MWPLAGGPGGSVLIRDLGQHQGHGRMGEELRFWIEAPLIRSEGERAPGTPQQHVSASTLVLIFCHIYMIKGKADALLLFFCEELKRFKSKGHKWILNLPSFECVTQN